MGERVFETTTELAMLLWKPVVITMLRHLVFFFSGLLRQKTAVVMPFPCHIPFKDPRYHLVKVAYNMPIIQSFRVNHFGGYLCDLMIRLGFCKDFDQLSFFRFSNTIGAIMGTITQKTLPNKLATSTKQGIITFSCGPLPRIPVANEGL